VWVVVGSVSSIEIQTVLHCQTTLYRLPDQQLHNMQAAAWYRHH
jgi:hypothetical protein